MRFVLDNSVSMRWLFEDGSSSDLKYSDMVLNALADGGAIVPAVWTLEVTNVIVRAERVGVLSAEKSDTFLKMLSGLPIDTETVTQKSSVNDILEIARRYKLSAYDASYLELSIRRKIPLATLDTDLRKASRKAGAKILR